MWLQMFILTANLAQQEQVSIFSYAQENLTVPKGEGMDSITFKTFAYLRPHYEPMRPLWRDTRTVPSLPLDLFGSLSKSLQWGATFLYPSPIS